MAMISNDKDLEKIITILRGHLPVLKKNTMSRGLNYLSQGCGVKTAVVAIWIY